MSQLLRHQQREQQEENQRMKELADRVQIEINKLVLKYRRTFEGYIEKSKNGSLIPKFRIIKADKNGLEVSRKFLLKNGIQPPDYQWAWNASKKFQQEAQNYQLVQGINLLPALNISDMGITPGFVWATKMDKKDLQSSQQQETKPVELPA